MQYESEYYGVTELGDTLEHHGISGMKWHHRRWQNEDGSLTPAGRIHYGVGEARDKVRTDKEPAKFSEWAKDQMKLGKSFSSVRLAAEGIKKDAQKVKDAFSSKKEPDADGDNHVSMNFWNGEMTVNGKKMLSRDGDQRTLDPRQQKGEISNGHDLSKLTAKDRRNLSWLVDRDFYEDAASGLDIGSKKYWDAVDNEARELGYKSYRDAAAVYNKLRDLKEKGHNPDGSLTERNADKLVKSIAKNGTDASLNYDKFADTEKKRAFTEASDNFAKLRAKTDKLIDDFYKDKKLSEKYLTAEAKKQWNTVSGLKQAWGSFDNYKNFVLKEDGDQGDAVHTWLSDKHADHINKQNAAGKAETKAREAYIAELLGQNANKVYKDLNPNRNISKTMYDPATRTMVKRPKTRTRTYKEILNGALIKRQWSTRTTISRAKAMKSQGMTNKEIADLLGVSPSTVSEYLD